MEFADTEMESTADEFARDGEMVTLVVLAKLKKGLMVSSAMLIFYYYRVSQKNFALLGLCSHYGEAVYSVTSIFTHAESLVGL